MAKKKTKIEEEIGNTEKYLQGIGKKLDKFFSKANEKTTQVKKDLEENLKVLRERVIKAKDDISNNEKWKEIEDDIKKSSSELENAVKSAFTKKPVKEVKKAKKKTSAKTKKKN